MYNITRRNLKLFFREKGTFFFSVLGVIIMGAIYILFLRKNYIENAVERMELKEAKALMDTWLLAGMVSVTSVTTTLGAFGVMIRDRASGKINDFKVSSISEGKMLGGYVFSASIIGMTISMILLIIGEFLLGLEDGWILSLIQWIEVVMIIFLSVFMAGACLFFIMSFIKNQGAFGTLSTLVGSLMGFLMSIYLPIGEMSSPMQWVVKLLPFSHGTVLLRQLLMQKGLEASFDGMKGPVKAAFEAALGISYHYENMVAGPSLHILVLVISGGIFYLLGIWRMRQVMQSER